jgi:integrase
MSNLCSPERAPAYRLHKRSGQAVVTIDGRDIYLGKYRSEASREAYRRKIAEWIQHDGNPPAPRHTAAITEVAVAYTECAIGYYRKNGKATDEVRMIKTAAKIIRELHGRTPVAEFGPLALKAVREQKIGEDWCRTHINKQVERVKRMFKWATENELIPGTVYESLRCVAGLKRGRTEAREGRKVKPISDTDLMATVEHMSAVVADMVQLQRFTGARRGEICDIRPGDINRKADPWEYVPHGHTTEHYDRTRVISSVRRSRRSSRRICCGQRILIAPHLVRRTRNGELRSTRRAGAITFRQPTRRQSAVETSPYTRRKVQSRFICARSGTSGPAVNLPRAAAQDFGYLKAVDVYQQ